MTSAAAKRVNKPKILEKHIQEGVTALLELDGWRPLRTDPVSDRYRGKGFGEVGMPDHLYIRYIKRNQDHPPSSVPSGVAELMWIEFKAPSKTAKPHQLEWHTSERRRGALVLVIDDFDKFRQWYADSGLNRRLMVALPVKSKTETASLHQ